MNDRACAAYTRQTATDCLCFWFPFDLRGPRPLFFAGCLKCSARRLQFHSLPSLHRPLLDCSGAVRSILDIAAHKRLWLLFSSAGRIVNRPPVVHAAVGYYDRSFPLGEARRQPLVVLPFNGYLLSSLLVPIHFFIAFFCKELISRRVFLYLVVDAHTPEAPQLDVRETPVETLSFLTSSRYCDGDTELLDFPCRCLIFQRATPRAISVTLASLRYPVRWILAPGSKPK